MAYRKKYLNAKKSRYRDYKPTEISMGGFTVWLHMVHRNQTTDRFRVWPHGMELDKVRRFASRTEAEAWAYSWLFRACGGTAADFLDQA